VRRILIVEPDPELARELFLVFHSEYGAFERDRYEPEIAGSVAEAAEKARSVEFDCAILDVNLPEMAGYEAVPFMKAIDDNLPLIVTGDENSIELEAKIREQDVYYYHLRCFGLDELKLAVRSVFETLQEVRRNRQRGKTGTRPVSLKRLTLATAKRSPMQRFRQEST